MVLGFRSSIKVVKWIGGSPLLRDWSTFELKFLGGMVHIGTGGFCWRPHLHMAYDNILSGPTLSNNSVVYCEWLCNGNDWQLLMNRLGMNDTLCVIKSCVTRLLLHCGKTTFYISPAHVLKPLKIGAHAEVERDNIENSTSDLDARINSTFELNQNWWWSVLKARSQLIITSVTYPIFPGTILVLMSSRL